MKPKSVLEVEILLWYYYSPYDINNIEAPAIQEAIDKFCKMGIMERILNQDKQVMVKQDALDVYVNAILNVNLPKIKWVCEAE